MVFMNHIFYIIYYIIYLLFFAGKVKKDNIKLFEDIVKCIIIDIKSLIPICKIVNKIVSIKDDNKYKYINLIKIDLF